MRDAVPFYPDASVVRIGCALPFLTSKPPVATAHWPSTGPEPHDVLKGLRKTRRCWAAQQVRKGQRFVRLVAGSYLLELIVGSSRDSPAPRLWFYGLRLARTVERNDLRKQGRLLEHEGLLAVSPRSFGDMERQDEFWSSGAFVTMLLQAIDTAAESDADDDPPDAVTIGQHRVADVLRTFVEAEHAIEEQAAREAPPFTFISLSALSRSVVYRQFFEVELLAGDHERLLECKPTLVALKQSSVQREPVVFEVVDLQPGRSSVHLSVERQVEAASLPSNGELELRAQPTLLRIRCEVIEALLKGTSPNRWLLPMLAEQYAPPPLALRASPPPEAGSLAPGQLRALRMGIATTDFGLVMGPPGTGKTTVILEWVTHFVAQGLRVLLTSQSNKAVDNVLERLAHDDKVECVRLGSELKIGSQLQHMLLDEKARQLQQRMFDRGDEVIRELEATVGYLDRWLAAQALRDKVARLQGDLRQAEASAWKSEHALAATRSTLAVVDSEEQAIAAKLDALGCASPGVFQRVLGVFGLDRRSRLLRRASKVAASKTAQEHALDRDQSRYALDAQQLEAAATSLREATTELAEAEPGPAPRSPVPEIDLHASMSRAHAIEAAKWTRSLLSATRNWFGTLRRERQQSLYGLLLEQVDVVGATCIGINTNRLFRDVNFDVVIIDEAGQIQVHNLAVPMSRAGKVLLVGDHKQLPPVVQKEVVDEIVARGAEDDRDLYDRSWFEVAWDNAPADRKVALDIQFRCPGVISDFVSEAFYEGNYHATPDKRDVRALFSWAAGPMVFVDTSAHPDRHEISSRSADAPETFRNELETRLILLLFERAQRERPDLVEQREVGIVVPYAEHARATRRAMARHFGRLGFDLGEFAATVDSFQGQERELMIVAFTRSNPRRQVGFLSDWRRLNVAMTRTKRQLIMVGDSSTLAARPNSPTARDARFKASMALLVRICKERGCLLDARELDPPRVEHPGSRIR